MSVLDGRDVVGLVPCHREPPDPSLLAALTAQVGGVLVVDDGMPPAAARALDALAGGWVGVLRLPRNRGKGHAIAAGIARLRGRPGLRGVLVIDADGQHPPGAAGRFIRAGRTADLVVGDRLGEPATMPWSRRAANRVASATLAAVTGRPVRDSQCGMRLLAGRALTEVPFPPGGYEAETVHLKRCLRAGLRVEWVAIPAIYEGAPSSFRPLRDSARVIAAALR